MADSDATAGGPRSNPGAEPTNPRPPEHPAAPPQPSAAHLPPGTLISHYRIESLIGEGGMGAVYLARQDKPDRQVALKVIRAGSLSPKSLRRFEHESQVLGRLQHPGIAQVYEAGTVPDHRSQPLPFFAMEFIKGVPLTDYAAQKSLGTRDRLDLISKVCDAVEHAHQKGVIHRDLKPGNILVDESGQPKVLDFGVARATDSDIQATTLQTDIGQLIGTVPYMSPEQVTGDPSDLDTRSDVYALGVIAYELLAGRLPYSIEKRLIHEVVRIIREEEPTRLSSINRTLRGDVETIVAHALEKDKSRRYQSAESLASDIRRYLTDQPITARPASTWYQLQKFSRRNRGLVTGVGAAFILLIAGLVGTSYGLSQAVLARDKEAAAHKEADEQRDAAVAARKSEEEQRKTAESQRDKAERIAEFMSDTLNGVGPSVARGRDIAMLKEMMDNAAARIEMGDLKSAPEAELRLRRTTGLVYLELSLYPEAAKMLEPAVVLARSLYPTDHKDTALTLDAMGRLAKDRGEPAAAEPLYRESLDMFRRLSPDGSESLAVELNNLAILLQERGDLKEAESCYRESLEMRRRLLLGDAREMAVSLNSMSYLLRARGDIAGAVSYQRESLEMFQRLYSGDHPDVATGLNNLGLLLLQRGDPAGAEPYVRDSLAMMKRLHPGNHPSVAVLLSSMGGLLFTRGDTAGAVSLYRESLEMRKSLFPGDNQSVAIAFSNLGRALQRQGDLAEAETHLRASLDMYTRLFKGDNASVATALGYLGEVRSERAEVVEGERLCRESLEMAKRLFKSDHPDLAESHNRLAAVLVNRADFAAAEPLAREGAAMSQRTSGKDHWRTGLARLTLGRALVGLKTFTDAEPELIEAQRVLSTVQGVPPGRHKHCVETLLNLYESWDKADPGKGHDTKANQWKAKLETMNRPSATEGGG